MVGGLALLVTLGTGCTATTSEWALSGDGGITRPLTDVVPATPAARPLGPAGALAKTPAVSSPATPTTAPAPTTTVAPAPTTTAPPTPTTAEAPAPTTTAPTPSSAAPAVEAPAPVVEEAPMPAPQAPAAEAPATAEAPRPATIAAPPAGASFDTGSEYEFLDLTNQARSAIGVGSLTRDASLDAYARAHAVEMAQAGTIYHSHAADLLSVWYTVGENVGVGPTTGPIQDALLASPGHYANISEGAFTHIGIGVTRGADGRIYVAHVFAA